MTTAGKKPDLVLVHGWGLGNAAWEACLPALSQRVQVHQLTLPGYDATAPDMISTPGMPATPVDKQPSGNSREDPHEQSPAEQAACRTRAFIETAATLLLQLPDNACVCGWSLGAMLALQMARLAPQRIRRLILVGGTPSFTQRSDWPHAQAPALLDSFSQAVNDDAAGTLQRFVALMNQGDSQARPLSRALNKTLNQTLRRRPIPDNATLLRGLAWLRDVDLRQQLPQAVPTLLIHGAHDPLMPLAAAQWLQSRLPQAQLEVFPVAAHAPFLNDPERFATLVGDYCHALDA